MLLPSLNLKLCLLNVENLFLLFDNPPNSVSFDQTEAEWQRLSQSVFENKSLRKCLALARAFSEINADIYMLCEVGGQESLQNFNTLFLDDKYSPVLIEGNSDRNIDIGFLVRKGSPFYYELFSNKNRPLNYLYPHERKSLAKGYPLKIQSHRFSRDAVELRLFKNHRDQPFFILLLTHLKSRLDKDRIDPAGFERRHAELKTLIEIYKEIELAHPTIPVVVAGDFNGNATATETDEEFRALYQDTKLQDVLEIDQVQNQNRWTFCQIRNGARNEHRQIDFAFLNESARKYLKPNSSFVYRFKDERGLEIDPPQNMDEKLLLPSDHYPIVFEVAVPWLS